MTEDLAAFFDALAAASAAAILPHFRSPLAVEDKHLRGVYDPVTVADRAGEAAMRQLIAERFPDHGILGEEYGSAHTDAADVWVLDPIDGTRAFISGLPTWGTLIGLRHDGVPVQGLMHQPFTGERFTGNRDRAWYRGPGGDRDLTTRPCTDLGDAVLFTTAPSIFSPPERAAYDAIERDVRLARYGADCYAYCMVAAGHVDLVIEAGLEPYDVVALIPIVEGAGGAMTSWTGGSAANGGRVVASGDKRLHDKVLARLATTPL